MDHIRCCTDLGSGILVGLGITTTGFGLLTACAIYKYYKFNGFRWIWSNEADLVLTPRIVSVFRNYTALRNALSDSSGHTLSNVIVEGMVGKHPSVEDGCIPELDLSINAEVIDVDTDAASMIREPCCLAKLLTVFMLKDSQGNEVVTVDDKSGKLTIILKSLIRKRENTNYLQYDTPVAITGDAELEDRLNENIILHPKEILKPITEQFTTINKIIIGALVIGIAGLVTTAILWCRYRRRRRNGPIPPRAPVHQPRDPIQEVGHQELDRNHDDEEDND